MDKAPSSPAADWLAELEARRSQAVDPGALDDAGRLAYRPQNRREFIAAACSLRDSGLGIDDVARVLGLTRAAAAALLYEHDHGHEPFIASAAQQPRRRGSS